MKFWDFASVGGPFDKLLALHTARLSSLTGIAGDWIEAWVRTTAVDLSGLRLMHRSRSMHVCAGRVTHVYKQLLGR